jgi:hypothetical protein
MNIYVNFVIFIWREYPEKIIKIEFFSFYAHDSWVVLILLYKMNVYLSCVVWFADKYLLLIVQFVVSYTV